MSSIEKNVYFSLSYDVASGSEITPILTHLAYRANGNKPVGTQRAYFELKYFKIVKMRDAKYSLKMAAEKWRQKFPFLNALYS